MNKIVLFSFRIFLVLSYFATVLQAQTGAPSPVPEGTVVSVTATDPHASEPGILAVVDDGVFTFSRSGSTDFDLTVYLQIRGSANNGEDYISISNRIVIPSGHTQAHLNIYPLMDNVFEGPETVTIGIETPVCAAVFPPPPGCYQVAPLGFATVTIRDQTSTNNLPAIRISSPEPGAIYRAGSNIFVSAIGVDPDGVLPFAEIFANGQKIGEAYDFSLRPVGPGIPSFFDFLWTNAPAGVHELVATATDADGNVATSAAVRIRVIAPDPDLPTVNVTATRSETAEPTELSRVASGVFVFTRTGSTESELPVYFRISGTAINGVDYHRLTNRVVIPAGATQAHALVSAIQDSLVEATETVAVTLFSPCLSFLSSDPASCYNLGPHTNAVVSIRDSQSGTNEPAILIRTGSIWKYLDNGTDQGVAWRAPAFDASSWASGPGQLGYGDGDESTILSFGPDPTSKYITTYFRRAFEISDASSVSNLLFRVLRDDGIVLYLNGVEIYRNGMPSGEITYDTLATTVAANENEYLPFTVGPNLLVNGRNVLAAEVHQVNPSSSDLGFDLELRVQRGETGYEPTVVSVVATDPAASEPGFIDIIDRGAFTFRRTGNLDHSIPVYFRVSGTASNGADYLRISNNVVIPAGQLEAIVYVHPRSDSIREGTETVTVTIEPPACIAIFPPPPQCYEVGSPASATVAIHDFSSGTNRPPSIVMTQPTNNASFSAGANLRISAVATDPDGILSLVEFFANGEKIGESPDVSGRPPMPHQPSLFSMIWSNAPAGTYELTSVTTDANGASTTSAAVRITVREDDPARSVVHIVATQPNTAEPGPNILVAPGEFTFYRSGSTEADLVVSYSIHGTAQHGIDYQELPGQITIPAGSSSAIVRVLPHADNIVEPTERVVLLLQTPPCGPNTPARLCYLVGEPNEAVVYIANTPQDHNTPPVVRVTSPANGETFTRGSEIPIRAVTSDEDGYAPRVEFFANGHKIGEQTISFLVPPPPGSELEFEFTWTNAPAGEHTLTAATVDNEGARSVSAPIRITVHSAPAGDRELHTVGLYSGLSEGSSSRNHETGVATVHVDRPGKHVTLFLSSYEPVLWHVSASENTTIEKVYLSGYYRQSITGLPEGVPVIRSSYEEGHSFLYIGHDINSSAFYEAVPNINQMTGMQISSFFGSYTAPEEPIVISEVQNDPRLRRELHVIPASELPDLQFEVKYLQEGRIVTKRYSLQGPVDGGPLVPGMKLVPDDSGHFYIGTRSHEAYKVDRSTGHEEQMVFGPELPELSWPRGVTLDPVNNRVLLVSLGGEGHLYGYSGGEWSVVSSMNNNDLDAITVHSNRIFGLTTVHGDSYAPRLQQFSFEGEPVGEPLVLPHQPFQYANHTYQAELIPIGRYIVFFSETTSSWSGTQPESRIYLIDPDTREVWLTYRRMGSARAIPPVVHLLAPQEGNTYTNGTQIRLRASATDADGVVERVEFYIDSLKVGDGTLDEAGNYSLRWTATPGRHVVWATATDSGGNSESSAQVSFFVSGVVPNPTIDDLCPCDSPWENRLDYLRCVINNTWTLFRDGHITELQRIEIIDTAAHSTCGTIPGAQLLLQPQTAAEIRENGLTLVISGADMENVIIESSTNLVDWVEVETSRTTSSAVSVSCANMDQDKTRFYRVKPAATQ